MTTTSISPHFVASPFTPYEQASNSSQLEAATKKSLLVLKEFFQCAPPEDRLPTIDLPLLTFIYTHFPALARCLILSIEPIERKDQAILFLIQQVMRTNLLEAVSLIDQISKDGEKWKNKAYMSISNYCTEEGFYEVTQKIDLDQCQEILSKPINMISNHSYLRIKAKINLAGFIAKVPGLSGSSPEFLYQRRLDSRKIAEESLDLILKEINSNRWPPVDKLYLRLFVAEKMELVAPTKATSIYDSVQNEATSLYDSPDFDLDSSMDLDDFFITFTRKAAYVAYVAALKASNKILNLPKKAAAIAGLVQIKASSSTSSQSDKVFLPAIFNSIFSKSNTSLEKIQALCSVTSILQTIYPDFTRDLQFRIIELQEDFFRSLSQENALKSFSPFWGLYSTLKSIDEKKADIALNNYLEYACNLQDTSTQEELLLDLADFLFRFDPQKVKQVLCRISTQDCKRFFMPIALLHSLANSSPTEALDTADRICETTHQSRALFEIALALPFDFLHANLSSLQEKYTLFNCPMGLAVLNLREIMGSSSEEQKRTLTDQISLFTLQNFP